MPIETGLGTVQLVLNFSQKVGRSTTKASVYSQNWALRSEPRASKVSFLSSTLTQGIHANLWDLILIHEEASLPLTDIARFSVLNS